MKKHRSNSRKSSKTAPIPTRPMEPPREQMARFELLPIVEKGVTIGRAYRSVPWFETLAKRGDITQDQLYALRFYRSRFDGANGSLTKSCLDVGGAGGGGGNGAETAALNRYVGDYILDAIDRAVGTLSSTLKAIAGEDKTYSEIAMERWGSVQIEDRGRQRIIPKAPSHPRIVKREFISALALMLPSAQVFYQT